MADISTSHLGTAPTLPWPGSVGVRAAGSLPWMTFASAPLPGAGAGAGTGTGTGHGTGAAWVVRKAGACRTGGQRVRVGAWAGGGHAPSGADVPIPRRRRRKATPRPLFGARPVSGNATDPGGSGPGCVPAALGSHIPHTWTHRCGCGACLSGPACLPACLPISASNSQLSVGP